MFPVAFQSDSFKQQRFEDRHPEVFASLPVFSVPITFIHVLFFCMMSATEAIRFPVHSKSAVEVIHYLDMLRFMNFFKLSM